MATLNPDVVLPGHPEAADVIGRGQRAAAGDKDAFLAPGLWARTVAAAKVAFEAELTKQQAGPTRK
jgi:metallo-beta-lactamase class B